MRVLQGGKHDDERGAALVEMALVLPFLMLLVVGIWATARAWNVHNVLDHAVRESVRHGATIDPWNSGTSTDLCGAGTSEGEMRCVADEQLSAASINTALVNSTCIELSANPCAVGSSTGSDKVAMTLTLPNYPIDFVFFTMTVDMSATAVARYES